jgi:TatD DNase family protein
MYIDSHCHINFPDLADKLPEVFDLMRHNQVSHALCISVELERFPDILALAESHPNVYASVGVHPDHEDCSEPSVEQLVELADHPKVVAIGETGLDYFRPDRRSRVAARAFPHPYPGRPRLPQAARHPYPFRGRGHPAHHG